MENLNLIETFSEFKELKNIDRATMMSVLEDVFRNMLLKKFGNDQNCDVIINIDKGDFQILRNRGRDGKFLELRFRLRQLMQLILKMHLLVNLKT